MSTGHDRGRPRQESAPMVTESDSQYDRRPQVYPAPRPWSDDHGRRHRWAVAQRLEPLHDGRRDPEQHQQFEFVVASTCPFGLTREQTEAERARLLAMGWTLPETRVVLGPVLG